LLIGRLANVTRAFYLATMKRFIALYRVSTQKQANSALGLESQRYSIRRYLETVGGELLAEYQETESGGNKDKISINMEVDIGRLLKKRPTLQKVIGQAQEERAVIVVKEASRLTRYSLLMNFFIASGLEFVCADAPNDTPFIIKIKTALHEEELLKVSERTKAAWQAKKSRGYIHRVPNNLTDQASQKSLVTRVGNSRQNENNVRASGYIRSLRATGQTYRAIAEKLNQEGFRASRGKKFVATQVRRLFLRITAGEK